MASPIMCRTLRTTLAARVLDTGRVPGWMEGHVWSCLRCQAVVAQSQRLRRTLTTLGPEGPETVDYEGAPYGLVAAGVASVAAAAVLVARARLGRR